MLSILGVSVLLMTVVVAFFFTTRDGFAKGLMVAVVACATLLSATAMGLLFRDNQLSQSLVSQLGSDAAATAVQQEQTRMVAVTGNYPRYRWAAAAIGCAALLILVFFRQPWLHGVAAGLLLLVVAQIIIDHYSEGRAATYLAQITDRRIPL